jgi:hypothetical protein
MGKRFAGRKKTQVRRQEGSGHDFSRAAHSTKTTWALAPEGMWMHYDSSLRGGILQTLGASGLDSETWESSRLRDHVLPPMRAALRINAPLSQPQPLHRPSPHQVLLHNRRRIRRLHMSIPNSFRINHHRRSVLALVQASRLVDAHRRAQPSRFRQLLQLRMQLALTIRGARRPRRIRRAGIMANKDMALECRQVVSLS